MLLVKSEPETERFFCHLSKSLNGLWMVLHFFGLFAHITAHAYTIVGHIFSQALDSHQISFCE